MWRKISDKPYIFILFGLIWISGLTLSTYLLIRNPNYGSDPSGYLQSVYFFINGQGEFSFFHPPGLGLLAYPIFLVLQDLPLAGSMVSWLCYLLLIVFVFAIGMRLGGSWTALLAAGFVAFNPMILRFSYQAMTEVPSALFLVLSFYFSLKIISGDRRLVNYILLGLVGGYSYFLRAQGLGIALLCLFLIGLDLLVLNHSRPGGFKRYFKESYKILINLCLVAAFVVPVVLYLHSTLGVWTISGKIVPYQLRQAAEGSQTNNFLNKLTKSIPASEQVDPGIKKSAGGQEPPQTATQIFHERLRRLISLTRIGNNIHLQVIHTMQIIFSALGPLLFTWLLYPWLCQSGLVLFEGFKPYRWPVWLLFFACLCPVSAYWLLWTYPRFLVPYIPVLLILIAVVITRMARTMTLVKPWLVMISASLVFVFCLFPYSKHLTAKLLPDMRHSLTISQVLTEHHPSVGLVKAGKWLHKHQTIDQHTNIFAPLKSYICLMYAVSDGIPVRDAKDRALYSNRFSIDEITLKMRSGQVKYLILDDYYIQKGSPEVLDLWQHPDHAVQYSLMLLHEDPANLFKIFIYSSKWSIESIND